MSGDQMCLSDRLHCSAPRLPHPQVQAVCSVTWMEAQVLLQRPAPSPHRPSITDTSRTRVLEAEHRRELPGEVEQPPEQRWTYSRNSIKLFNYSRTNSAIYQNIDTEHILVPLPQLRAVSQY